MNNTCTHCRLNEDCIAGYKHENECRFPSYREEERAWYARVLLEAWTELSASGAVATPKEHCEYMADHLMNKLLAR